MMVAITASLIWIGIGPLGAGVAFFYGLTSFIGMIALAGNMVRNSVRY